MARSSMELVWSAKRRWSGRRSSTLSFTSETNRRYQQLHCTSQMLLVACTHATTHVGRFSHQQTLTHEKSLQVFDRRLSSRLQTSRTCSNRTSARMQLGDTFVALVSAGLKPADVHIISICATECFSCAANNLITESAGFQTSGQELRNPAPIVAYMMIQQVTNQQDMMNELHDLVPRRKLPWANF